MAQINPQPKQYRCPMRARKRSVGEDATDIPSDGTCAASPHDPVMLNGKTIVPVGQQLLHFPGAGLRVRQRARLITNEMF